MSFHDNIEPAGYWDPPDIPDPTYCFYCHESNGVHHHRCPVYHDIEEPFPVADHDLPEEKDLLSKAEMIGRT